MNRVWLPSGDMPMIRPMTPEAWRRAVFAVVGRIPRGRVATYGLVGMLAGRPLAARAVGNALRHCDDPQVPCHRVVHSDGVPAFAAHRARLRREGVLFLGPARGHGPAPVDAAATSAPDEPT